jgi:hypothetical protein
MPRRPRQSDPPAERSFPVVPHPSLGLLPWGIPTRDAHAVHVTLERSRRIIRVIVPFPGGKSLAPADATVAPLVVSLPTRDREAWRGWLAQDPTRLGGLVFEQLIMPEAPRLRGRHARPARSIPRRILRTYATEIYLVLERYEGEGDRAVLEALKRHAQARAYDCGRHFEQGGQWSLSRMTAYVVEVGYPGAWNRAAPPTTDPQGFYRAYIQHRQLPTLKAVLARRRRPFPHAGALLARLLEEAPPPLSPARPDGSPAP